MKIKCTTQFDITATGVTGHFKPSRIPFVDAAGNSITNEQKWNHARNKQRNWETITQLISLRTQVENLTVPALYTDCWTFEFEVESDTLFWLDNDPLGVLKADCKNVPMLTGLDETITLDGFLTNENIWFEPINIL